jgi:hypothetical protein
LHFDEGHKTAEWQQQENKMFSVWALTAYQRVFFFTACKLLVLEFSAVEF